MEYKGYYISPVKEHPKVYYISTVGRGGKVPDVMTGFFTSPTVAREIIDIYVASKEKGVKEDAKTIVKSGS
jgi:hypothetical protein